jgi:hypothetical protein
MTIGQPRNDDPRRLRDLLLKISGLAREHSLRSVVVGMAGVEGDRLYPEVIDYVESTLRMDDSIVRLTRERSVLFLTDVDREGAEDIMARVLIEFHNEYPSMSTPSISLGYFEIGPESVDKTLKEVLPTLFTESMLRH